MVGKAGLNRIMTHEMDGGRRVNYKYKNKFLKKVWKDIYERVNWQLQSKNRKYCFECVEIRKLYWFIRSI